MATKGIDTLVLEVDVRRGVESLLKTVCTHKRSRTIELILIPHLLGDIYPCMLHVELLLGTFGSKDMTEVVCGESLVSCGVKRWQRFVDHIGLNIIPLLGNLVFIQNKFLLS